MIWPECGSAEVFPGKPSLRRDPGTVLRKRETVEKTGLAALGRMVYSRRAEPKGSMCLCVRSLWACSKASCGNSCLNCLSGPTLLPVWWGRGRHEVRNILFETCSQCVCLEDLAWFLSSTGRRSSDSRPFLKKWFASFWVNTVFICCLVSTGTRVREENVAKKEG